MAARLTSSRVGSHIVYGNVYVDAYHDCIVYISSVQELHDLCMVHNPGSGCELYEDSLELSSCNKESWAGLSSKRCEQQGEAAWHPAGLMLTSMNAWQSHMAAHLLP